jgi:eukaryotic-like serine/threonine-protein kinase
MSGELMATPNAALPVAPSFEDILSGNFTIERELGRGGMGVVYLARDLRLDRLVALKALPPHLSQDGELRERFLREARTAAKLSHPNIVPVYFAAEESGHAYFSMAYIDGESLADRVATRGPLPWQEVSRYVIEVAQALAYANARGVVHRDVKPENIIVDRGANRPIVTDFGIARDVATSRMTQEGLVMGTAYVASPEQIAGEAVDGRSDLYSLGVVAYFAATGRFPFESGSASAVLMAHMTQRAPSIRGLVPDLPPGFASIVEKLLEKEPDARYRTGEELADALKEVMSAHAAVSSDAGISLSEMQARALWKRAAELQAEALSRLEARLPAASGADLRQEQHGDRASSGYRLEHVRSAAVEAGISEQFVALALAELPRNDSGIVLGEEGSDWQSRQGALFLGTSKRSCSVSRVMRASPSRILRIIGHTFQQSPFDLRLLRTVGGHPLDGGVMIFDLPGATNVSGQLTGAVASHLSSQWMATRHTLEAEHVQVAVRHIPSDPGSCEVSLFVDLRPGVRQNVNASVGFSAGFGVLGGALGSALIAKAAGIGLLAIGPGAGIAVGIGALVLGSYRWVYRSTIDKAVRELNKALDALEGGLQSEEVFSGALPGAFSRPRAQLDDGTISIIA